jgi:hypothetical protein
MLDTLSAQLNLSAVVDGVLSDWSQHFHHNWCNFANLSFLLFHDNAGNQVNNTTTENDSAVLLPMIDGPLDGCRKQICFVQVQLNLDFSSLVSQGIQGVTVLRVEYYIELPQGLRNLQNGYNQPYCLTTFLGAEDLHTIAATDFAQDILTTTLQDGPNDLLCPDFKLNSAKIDSIAIKAEINSKIIHLATPLVLNHLFNQLCPGYSKKPHAVLNHIWKTYDDAEGNTILSLVYEYYTQILAASRPFMDQEILPVSVCQAFIDGLDSCLMPGLKHIFPTIASPRIVLPFTSAKSLKKCTRSLFALRWSATTSGLLPAKEMALAASARVNASQAEKTIKRYSSGDDTNSNKSLVSSWGRLCCYDCEGPHPWSLLENGIHVIKCPNTNNPGILNNAKKVIKRICNKRKKKQQDFTKRKNLAITNYSYFNKAGKEIIQKQVLNSVSTHFQKYKHLLINHWCHWFHTHAFPRKKGPDTHCLLVQCQGPQQQHSLSCSPSPIQSVVPYIQLQLGMDINNSSCPSIHCVVDTTTALCTGNYHFFLAIAKRFPQCVAKIFLPEDYSPIILSGIVQDNANAIMADLPVAFQFHLPSLTKDGSTTSFVVATGPRGSVNMVLGLPLITATGMIINFINNVVDAKHLDCPPFPIEFCCAMKKIAADDASKTNYIKFKDVQQVLQKSHAYIAGVCKHFTLAVYVPLVRFSGSTKSGDGNHSHSGNDAADASGMKRHHCLVSDSSAEPYQYIAMPWIPPVLAHDTSNNYHDQVLGDAGYLLAPIPP